MKYPLYSLLAAAAVSLSGLHAATYNVTNTTDSSDPGSLRWAVEQANNNPGPDVIDMSGVSYETIQLNSNLTITDQVNINGSYADIRSYPIQINANNCFVNRLDFYPDFGRAITIAGSANTVSNCYFYASQAYDTAIVHLLGNSNYVVENDFRNGRNGVSVGGMAFVTNNIIAYNTFGTFGENGVEVVAASNTYIYNNRIGGARNGVSITGYYSFQNFVFQNNIDNNYIGVYVASGASYNYVGPWVRNEFRRNTMAVVLGAFSQDGPTYSNMVISNSIERDYGLKGNDYGIVVTSGSMSNFVNQNFVTGCTSNGIWLYSAYNNYITQNAIGNNGVQTEEYMTNGGFGLVLESSSSNNVSENSFGYNTYGPYYIDANSFDNFGL